MAGQSPNAPPTCRCECHRAPDEESPLIVVVSLFDPIETYAAGSCCRNAHWQAIYLATEPKLPPPRERSKWVEPPRPQADGWQGDP